MGHHWQEHSDYRRPRRGQGGPPPWLQDIFGAFGQPQRPAPRGPKVRRGDVRVAIASSPSD